VRSGQAATFDDPEVKVKTIKVLYSCVPPQCWSSG